MSGDAHGFASPGAVEAGTSGDFYAIDQYRNRIVRISGDPKTPGKVLRSYNYERVSKEPNAIIEDFRVSEEQELFVLNDRLGNFIGVGFDGKRRWVAKTDVNSKVGNGGFDLDAAGVLYYAGPRSQVIQRLSVEGKPLEDLRLQWDKVAGTPAQHAITGVRLADGGILLKRQHPTEMFLHFNRGGELEGATAINHERLAADFPSEVWTAGEDIPLKVQFTSSSKNAQPRWRAWWRPIDFPNFRELPIGDGKIHVPETANGLYYLRISNEIKPWQAGNAPDHIVRGWVEVRRPGSRGTLNVLSVDNRISFTRGSAIPLTLRARSGEAGRNWPVQVELRELGGNGEPAKQVLHESTLTLVSGASQKWEIPATLTSVLRTGSYIVTATSPEMTAVPLRFHLSKSGRERPLHFLMHGDYTAIYPISNAWDAVDAAEAHAARLGKMGFNLVLDRIGAPTQSVNLSPAQVRADMQSLRRRLESDPAAADPEKAMPGSSLLQTVGAYNHHGLNQMAMLTLMDAPLPIGDGGFDHRNLGQMQTDLKTVTKALLPFENFRGWSWAPNWWVFRKRGADAANTPEEKAEYLAALKVARETGAWSPVLERVANRRLSYAVEMQDAFKKALNEVATGLVTANAASYRNVESYPPISFSNIDEVDLQAQWEQVAVPYYAPHNVDFYGRPGKPALGHPELWSDPGTGDQIVPTTFNMLMRGARGVGMSGKIPRWGNLPVDSRTGYQGMVSVFRAMNTGLEPYGPWLAGLQNDDQTAIVVSGRMFKIDEWTAVMGRHFARILEAYTACLAVHQPASIIFVEDMKPETLARYKSVLVVGQTVEMEPELVKALQTARARGSKVFYDATCRASLMQGYTPLGFGFDHFVKDPHPASDDSSFLRFRRDLKAVAAKLAPVLNAAQPPLATLDDEVFLSRRKSEAGRYLFVVNNALMPLEPGQMWRTTLHTATVAPMNAELPAPTAGAIYDVLAQKRVQPRNQKIQVDLANMQARLYAFLPAAIERLAVTTNGPAQRGQSFKWWVQVRDAANKPIAAAVPLRVRLLAGGEVVEEEFHSAGSQGVGGQMLLPINAPGGPLTLQVAELLGGMVQELPLAAPNAPASVNAPKVGETSATSKLPAPFSQSFGPRIRDMVLSGDGRTVVASTLNWDTNLYALDAETGQIKWRKRVGHYFAFEPKATNDGFTAQGFDFNTAEGYHLYQGDTAGNIQRRFALYGVPRRLAMRFIPSSIKDQINSFAVAADGSWVAAAGDLGVVVWTRDGRQLWSRDDWKTNRNRPWMAGVDSHQKAQQFSPQVVALDDATLAIAFGDEVEAVEPATGKRKWRVRLSESGQVQRAIAAGGTLAVASTLNGGSVFLVRDGQVVRTIPGNARDFAVSSDGQQVAIVNGSNLSLHHIDSGLAWTLPADDALGAPRFSRDSSKVAVSSELGTLYVAERSGKLLLEKDIQHIATPLWLTDGSLLVGDWSGRVQRFNPDFETRWSSQLAAVPEDIRPTLTAPEPLPTSRVVSWGNAEEKPLPLQGNLLTAEQCVISFNNRRLDTARETLTDGKSEPSAEPWVDWTTVFQTSEVNTVNYLVLDAFRTQMRVTGITIVEDPRHPESWLRDAYIESWDPRLSQWTFQAPLVSNSAVHSHVFEKPIEASRLRIMLPWGMVGSLRMSEIVLHGERLGPSHPDVSAKKPQAVLFDEGDDLAEAMIWGDKPMDFAFEDSYSGGRHLALKADRKADAIFTRPFGHTIPNWDFEIVEQPEAGQYRYLQFAWRTTTPAATGAMLSLNTTGGNFALAAGGSTAGANTARIDTTVPATWKTVRVDLWDLFKKPVRLRSFGLAAKGGPVNLDQMVLGRTAADLPPEHK